MSSFRETTNKEKKTKDFHRVRQRVGRVERGEVQSRKEKTRPNDGVPIISLPVGAMNCVEREHRVFEEKSRSFTVNNSSWSFESWRCFCRENDSRQNTDDVIGWRVLAPTLFSLPVSPAVVDTYSIHMYSTTYMHYVLYVYTI